MEAFCEYEWQFEMGIKKHKCSVLAPNMLVKRKRNLLDTELITSEHFRSAHESKRQEINPANGHSSGVVMTAERVCVCVPL